jgi:hypothetical protein
VVFKMHIVACYLRGAECFGVWCLCGCRILLVMAGLHARLARLVELSIEILDEVVWKMALWIEDDESDGFMLGA